VRRGEDYGVGENGSRDSQRRRGQRRRPKAEGSGIEPRRHPRGAARRGCRRRSAPRRGEDGGVELAAALWRNRERIVGAWDRGSARKDRVIRAGRALAGSQLDREETRAWPSGAGANVAVCLGEAEEAASGGGGVAREEAAAGEGRKARLV